MEIGFAMFNLGLGLHTETEVPAKKILKAIQNVENNWWFGLIELMFLFIRLRLKPRVYVLAFSI